MDSDKLFATSPFQHQHQLKKLWTSLPDNRQETNFSYISEHGMHAIGKIGRPIRPTTQQRTYNRLVCIWCQATFIDRRRTKSTWTNVSYMANDASIPLFVYITLDYSRRNLPPQAKWKIKLRYRCLGIDNDIYDHRLYAEAYPGKVVRPVMPARQFLSDASLKMLVVVSFRKNKAVLKNVSYKSISGDNPRLAAWPMGFMMWTSGCSDPDQNISS